MIRPPPTSTLFPYTTLFRSFGCGRGTAGAHVERELPGLVRRLGVDAEDLERTERGDVDLEAHGDLAAAAGAEEDRKSTRLNSSHVEISYAVFCLKEKNQIAP